MKSILFKNLVRKHKVKKDLFAFRANLPQANCVISLVPEEPRHADDPVFVEEVVLVHVDAGAVGTAAGQNAGPKE